MIGHAALGVFSYKLLRMALHCETTPLHCGTTPFYFIFIIFFPFLSGNVRGEPPWRGLQGGTPPRLLPPASQQPLHSEAPPSNQRLHHPHQDTGRRRERQGPCLHQ